MKQYRPRDLQITMNNTAVACQAISGAMPQESAPASIVPQKADII